MTLQITEIKRLNTINLEKMEDFHIKKHPMKLQIESITKSPLRSDPRFVNEKRFDIEVKISESENSGEDTER